MDSKPGEAEGEGRLTPPKTNSGVNIRAEIESIRRIVNGANKRLERLSESLERFNEQIARANK